MTFTFTTTWSHAKPCGAQSRSEPSIPMLIWFPASRPLLG